MKRFAKLAIGVLALAGAATVAAAPASARVFVSIGAPLMAPIAAPVPACNPYTPYYNPYYCGPTYAEMCIRDSDYTDLRMCKCADYFDF